MPTMQSSVPSTTRSAVQSTVRTTVLSVRTGLTAGALTLLVGLACNIFTAPEAPSTDQIGLSSRGLDAMMERFRCSTTGFARDVIPSQAIVARPGGLTEVVSFDLGWQVFQGDAPGELVAVCLGERRARR